VEQVAAFEIQTGKKLRSCFVCQGSENHDIVACARSLHDFLSVIANVDVQYLLKFELYKKDLSN